MDQLLALIINRTNLECIDHPFQTYVYLKSISSDFKAKTGFKLQQAVNARFEWQYCQPTFRGLSSAANLNSIHSKLRSIPSQKFAYDTKK